MTAAERIDAFRGLTPDTQHTLNANGMKKNHKLFFFVVGFFTILIVLIIYRYEKLLTQAHEEMSLEHATGGTSTTTSYDSKQIIALIRSSKEYLGDSITILDNGAMKSSNSKFQGTIQAVISSKDNMDMVRSSMVGNKLPIQYNIYVLAATYYRNQYAGEFAPPTK